MRILGGRLGYCQDEEMMLLEEKEQHGTPELWRVLTFLVGKPAIMTEVFLGFPRCLSANS